MAIQNDNITFDVAKGSWGGYMDKAIISLNSDTKERLVVFDLDSWDWCKITPQKTTYLEDW